MDAIANRSGRNVVQHILLSLKVGLFVLKIFKMAANIKIKKSLTIQK
jgi:hypothetical protein